MNTTQSAAAANYRIETHQQLGGVWRIDIIDPRTNSLVNRRKDVSATNVERAKARMLAEMAVQ